MNVEQFATELKVDPALLVKQLQAAGVGVQGTRDELSDQDKTRLLDYLRGKHGAKEPKTKITLTRKQSTEIKTADSAGRTRTVQVEVRKKRVLVKREGAGAESAASEVLPAEMPIPVIEEPQVPLPEPVPEVIEAPVPAVEPEVVEPAPEPEVTVEAEPAPAPEPTVTPRVIPSILSDSERKAREDEARRTAQLRAIQEAELKAKQEREAARRQAEEAARAKPAEPAKPGEVKPAVKPTVKPKAEKDKTAAKKGREEPAPSKRPGLKTRGAVDGGDGWRAKKGRHKSEHETAPQMPAEPVVREVVIPETISVADLAHKMSVKAAEVIKTLMKMGSMVTINQVLDQETAMIVVEEMGHVAKPAAMDTPESYLEEAGEHKEAELKPRAPVVTVMGHVDHGKTSLLDHIRKANVIAGEAGGITQHIGAYSVTLENGKRIAFLDTPGHEAFTAMRARGAQVTDIAIIVIAADDSVMPQTREAINHAQAAGVPMVFAFNKIDKPQANAERIREQLSQMNILVEEWGGKFQTQEISAKKGIGVDQLLEKVLLEAEILDLKADPGKRAMGVVIESTLEQGRGYVTTLLVEAGTLRKGDTLLVGQFSGRVRNMFNERGQAVAEAGPSTPVSILGLDGAPNAGDHFYVMEDEREARQIATRRQQLQREQGMRTRKHITLDEIGRRLAIGDFKELNVIVKGDVDGSVEALTDSLLKLSTENIKVNVIHKAVGPIAESDVLLASASNAIIVGFQVRPTIGARKLAETEEIEIRLYSIIYNAIEELKQAMEGMLAPKEEEKVVGTAEVRDTFRISKVGTVAGCYVLDGKITRNSRVRLIRDGIVVYTGEISDLKRFKDDVKEVTHGYECGLSIKNFNDIKAGDNVEAFEIVEVKRTLGE